ncbi:MAG TPA: hypothetical protein ENI23_01345 [bacterium]|nr:hypothetical protein [bacterium]
MKNFFKQINRYDIAALLFSLVFFLLAVFSTSGFEWNNLKYSGDAVTSDEVSHIGSGYYYLKTGRYFINPEHPPVIKDVAGLPLLFIDTKEPRIEEIENFTEDSYPYEDPVISKNYELSNSQWHWARLFIFGNESPDLIVLLSRISMSLMNAGLIFALYLLLKKTINRRVGLVSVFVFTFSQFFIANGSLVIMDFTSSVFQVLTLVAFAVYLKSKDKERKKYFVWSVIFLAFSLLVKFSSILLLPALFITGVIYVLVKKEKLFGYIKEFTLLSIFTGILVAIYYGFHSINMTGSEMSEHFDILLSNFSATPIGDFYKFLANINIPIIGLLTKGIAQYMLGVFMVFNRVAGALQTTYFLGEVYSSEGTSILYFPVLFFTKLPLVLLLALVGLVVAFVYKYLFSGKIIESVKRVVLNRIILTSLFVYSFLYLALTLNSALQIGLRHLMPVIMAAYVMLAIGMDRVWNMKLLKSNYKYMHLFIFSGVVMVASTLLAFPHYLSYYNILGGGTDNGYEISTDSNYDWAGQDLKRLGKWLKENNIDEVYTHIFTNAEQEYYLGDNVHVFDYAKDELPPSGSYLVVSVFEYQNNVYSDSVPEDRKYTQIDDYRVERVGKTMFVYQIP